MPGALLFDLDGTLLQSDALHARVFRELFAEHGVTLAEGDYDRHILGRTNREIFGHFLPGHDWRPLDDEKEARFRDRLGHSAEETAGLTALLDRAEARGLKLALVTNAPRANAEAMLAAIGHRHRFPVVVAAGEAPPGKPDPAPYLRALDLTGTAPRDALAFEDSVPGLTAAVAAGIPTVGLRSSLTHDTLARAGATLTIDTFTDPALGPLLDRLTGAAA